MRRATLRSLEGAALSAGAPLGGLIIDHIRGAPAAADVGLDTVLYLYMLLGSLIMFGVFGFLLGRREDQLMEVNRRLNDLAVTDALTGLRNARYFHARLAEEHATMRRTGEPLSLVILDLDHFKLINDEYGHLVGDKVLANTASAIAMVMRRGDTAARVGGEEFALLLPATSEDAAVDAAERVCRAIAAVTTALPEPHKGVARLTASAGVACSSGGWRDAPLQLYRAADEALYRAKTAGRNRTVVFHEAGPQPMRVRVAAEDDDQVCSAIASCSRPLLRRASDAYPPLLPHGSPETDAAE